MNSASDPRHDATWCDITADNSAAFKVFCHQECTHCSSSVMLVRSTQQLNPGSDWIVLGYWALRCDSLHLCLPYFYDTKITLLTDLMTLSSKETLFTGTPQVDFRLHHVFRLMCNEVWSKLKITEITYETYLVKPDIKIRFMFNFAPVISK